MTLPLCCFSQPRFVANNCRRTRFLDSTNQVMSMPVDKHDCEWLEADGLGGFASGTVSTIRTRRYHALLLSAASPSTGRMVLVNGLEASVQTAAGQFALWSQRYLPDVTYPDAAHRIESFTADPWPCWILDRKSVV
jgi:glycogen debranching enzyme